MFEKSDNELSVSASAFTEHPLKSITVTLQNLHETMHTIFYKHSKNV